MGKMKKQIRKKIPPAGFYSSDPWTKPWYRTSTSPSKNPTPWNSTSPSTSPWASTSPSPWTGASTRPSSNPWTSASTKPSMSRPGAHESPDKIRMDILANSLSNPEDPSLMLACDDLYYKLATDDGGKRIAKLPFDYFHSGGNGPNTAYNLAVVVTKYNFITNHTPEQRRETIRKTDQTCAEMGSKILEVTKRIISTDPTATPAERMASMPLFYSSLSAAHYGDPKAGENSIYLKVLTGLLDMDPPPVLVDFGVKLCRIMRQ